MLDIRQQSYRWRKDVREIKEMLVLIDKRMEFIAKGFDAMMKEILDAREDRIFMIHKINDHGTRISRLEATLVK